MRAKKKHQDSSGLLAADWEVIFKKAGIQSGALEVAKSPRARATSIGTFLGKNLGREVLIEVEGRPGRATLLVVDAGRRQRRFCFEIVMEDQEPLKDRRFRDPGGVDGLESSAASAVRTGSVAEKTERLSAKERASPKGPAPLGNEEDWS